MGRGGGGGGGGGGGSIVLSNMKHKHDSCQQNLQLNWKNGHHTLTRIECHSEKDKGVHCLQYDNEKIVSGHKDNTIKVCVCTA